MSYMQQCVLPEDCMCEVAGVRYWPGQQMKVDCEICVCERGRPQRCQPNPDCSGESVKLISRSTSNLQFISTHILGIVLHLPKSLSSHTQSALSCCSTLWLVVMVRVGRLLGALWCSECPVVIPQPKQPHQAWRWQNVQRNLQESPSVCSPLLMGL